VTGIIITKLDGTAKGGMVFAVSHELDLPVRFIGTGEKMGDIAPFDPDAFIDGLFETDQSAEEVAEEPAE
jgi:fused signal recognition particle receptor